jgi:hypothetical protein
MPGRPAVPLGLLTALAVLLLAAPGPARAAVVTHLLRIDLRDSNGKRIDARVSARSDSFATWYPIATDTTTQAHAGYGYPPSGGGLTLPHGWITLNVSRGPEYVPDNRRLYLAKDTLITVTIKRFLDMRARGFFASDLHVHSRHDPVEFVVSPVNSRRIARAEDLAIFHLLDQDYRFTGTNDPLSDGSTLIYHSYEYRHQTYGHVVLPGLRQTVEWGCCLAPAEAWPTLGDLAPAVAGPSRALFVLAHPGTTSDFDEDTHWPGTGLAREYPLLAASGALNGLELVSYSNDPYERWNDWYDALSCGLALPPTAGTDAVLDWFASRPAGGWRVYAEQSAGATLNYNNWIEAVRAGRTFVTSLPLVPRFRLGGVAPGGTLEAAADSSSLTVSFEAQCVSGLSRLSLVADRGVLWTLDLSRRSPRPTKLDTTFTLRTATPGWLALKVEGVAGDRALLGLPAIAHTNAVRLLRNGQPRRDAAACGRMLDRVDALEQLLDVRRNWSAAWHEDSLRARIERARTLYGQVFRVAPAHFEAEVEADERTPRLQWSRAADNEPGDHVRYRITLAADSSFADASVFFTDSTWIQSTPARAGLPSCWRIEAIDRGGNVTPCDPPMFSATLLVNSTGAPGGPAVTRPRLWPNPARGPVRLEGLGADVMIVDVAGRRVASPGRGLRSEGALWVWDVRALGRRVPPGLYFALSRSRGVSLPVTVLP